MTLSISSYCSERLSSSFSSSSKICFSLSISSVANVIFDYFVSSSEGFTNLEEEMRQNEDLLLGNQIINGIIILNEKMEKIMETIKTLKISFNLKNFSIIHFNGTTFKAFDFMSFNEINVKVMSKEETYTIFKDYFIFFTNFNYVYNDKGYSNFNLEELKKVKIFQIKENDVLVSIDDEINLENQKNSIRSERIKDFTKNMKNEFKQSFNEANRIEKTPNFPIKELTPFLGLDNNKVNDYSIQTNLKRVAFQVGSILRIEDDLKENVKQLHEQTLNEFDRILKDINENCAFFLFKNECTPFCYKAILKLDEHSNILSDGKKEYHFKYDLAKDRPFFRKFECISHTINFKANQNEKLKNVHHFLNCNNPIKGGRKSLIYGNYVYHHYMQDNFDDNGWGCAYRSLQTVLSWFIEQSFSPEFPIPTHKEIQQLLVSMNDKPKEFIGSQEWIGAFEVCLIIRKLIKIECKILHLGNGADIMSKVPELFEHFATQGTPVMFGGGVLAFTLLGIDYDSEKNEVNFLILDPHYKGSDNIKNIIEKGGISWKKESLFLPNTFYNFCLPQRPDLI